MQDLIGHTLGHYRIVDKIGEGGMGVVYRARDERLDRDVAVKVLSDAVAEDAQRLARFEREAKLLASLSHQNIATLYGLEEHDGQRFLVMELADGETLAARIKKGPIPVDDALEYARQISEGLEAAHEVGIIHRDLKPANVMVSPEGTVKVLDFGLAKAWQTEGGDADLTHSPTLTGQMTTAGMLVGTAAYMSPEQARGRNADNKADIWAFGVVLYEMITGCRAFAGDTTSDILASIIKDDPNWGELPAGTPHHIRRLLRRCLTKDPRDRLHDIADARIMMQEVFELPAGLTSEETMATAGKKIAPGLLGTIVAVLAGAALTASLTLLIVTAGKTADEDTTCFAVNLPTGSQLDAHYGEPLAISPDGRQLVFVATMAGTRRLFLRPVSSFESAPIGGTEGARNPVFSPDGSWVAFFANGKLKKVSLADGSVVTISETHRIGPVCWATENRILFAAGAEVFSVSASGGQPEIVSIIGAEPSHMTYRSINSVRGGEEILLTYSTGGGLEGKRIDIVSTASAVRRTLIQGGEGGQFSSSNHLVFSRGHTLLAAPFDLDRLELAGPAVQVFRGPTVGDDEASFSARFRISETGTLVYAPDLLPGDGVPVWVDREGRVERILEEPRNFWAPTISPDGRSLALSTTERVMETWILDLDRNALSRFTFQGSNHFSIWRPDGKQIAISSNRDGPFNLYLKPADGSDTTERVTFSDWHQDPGSWSPDGRVLAFAQNNTETSWDIWLAHIGGERRQEAFLSTRFREHHPMISPDGRWLAYQSDETGRFEVYVQPFPEGGGKWLVSVGGGTEPLWARNGEELFYRNGNRVMAASIPPGPDFEAESPALLFEGPFLPSGGFGSPGYDITPNGHRFVMIAPETPTPQTEFYVVVNWLEDLKRLAPTD